MILRRRDLVGCPSVLADVGSPAAQERQKAQNYYMAYPAPTKNMTFSVYGHEEVKSALNRLFGYKCAYCETDFGAAMPVDVEHFRPKGGVIDEAGNLRFPGYWWLASSWDNLLPSCIDCNRRRWQQGDTGSYKRGKENLFPLAGRAAPATNAAGVALEQPLLINPAVEAPDQYLKYVYKSSPAGRMESVVEPVFDAHGIEDAKGRASIDTYGLNRDRLSISRRKMIEKLKSALDDVQFYFEQADQETDPAKRAALKARGRDAVRRLTRNFLHWSNPYAAACRAYYRNWLEGLRFRAEGRLEGLAAI